MEKKSRVGSEWRGGGGSRVLLSALKRRCSAEGASGSGEGGAGGFCASSGLLSSPAQYKIKQVLRPSRGNC